MRHRTWLRQLIRAACAIPVGGTLLSLSRHPHWIFRLWDFPRVQLASLAALGALGYGTMPRKSAADRALLAATGAVIAWQLYRIRTFTPLRRPTVKRVRDEERDDDQRITLLISNVRMENEQHDRLLDMVRRVDPDVLLAVEIDDRWNAAIEPLAKRFPYAIRHPRNNWYGMVLLSKLELVEPRIDFLVQDDIPSIHTRIRLRSGVEVTLHGLHPRPPEPIRDESSAARDAELVVVGRAIGDDDDHGPTIVAGDLNDVAWSPTSELFVRLSGLLDPRAGRGLFNTYNANNPLFRYPLDHVFHSNHFELVRIERMPSIGSDHFPMLIELQYVPAAEAEQDESHERPHDRERAEEKLEKEREER